MPASPKTEPKPAPAAPGAEVFRAVFETGPRPLLLIAADPPKYTMLAVNAAHARAYGTTTAALEGRGVFEVFPPDPPPEIARFVEAVRASFDRVMASGGADQVAPARLMVAGAGGEPAERYVAATNTPLFGDDGTITHILSATQDVTGEVLERRSEQARLLLMREVDHRARNALAVVQALVRLSSAGSVDEFRAVLDGRIESLARAQTSLAARKWEGAFLSDIVAETLAALAPDARASAEGPRVVLPPSDVQALSMILHELATNAVKYGSIARPSGALSIVWERREDRAVRLVWREDGRQGRAAPEREGFGARLIAQLAAQLRGSIVYDWRPTGLVAELVFAPGAERAADEA